MWNKTFIYREIRYGGWQAVVFVLCVALSLVSLVVVNSFRRDISGAVVGDARILHGADIIVSSSYPFSKSLNDYLKILQEDGSSKVNGWEFYSVATSETETLLCNVKVIEEEYPLYGELQLQSGRALHDILVPGNIVAAKAVVERMGLKIGESVRIGEATLTLADVIEYDPTRPVDIFSFGPRVIASKGDLEVMNVLGKSSRVKYQTYIKAEPGEVAGITKRLQTIAKPSGEKVESALTARSAVKRFFNNLFFFLALISIFTLLLSGIGMQNGLSALLQKQKQSQAICRSLGATGGFIIRHYLLVALILGFLGALLGIIFAIFTMQVLPHVFSGLLPPASSNGITLTDIVEGSLIGFVVVLFFTFLPLYRLKWIKPNLIFRGESVTVKHDYVFWLLVLVGVVGFSLLVIRQLEDIQLGLLFVAELLMLIAVVTAIVKGLLWAISKMRMKSLSLRLAKRSLMRPGNGTLAIGTTLGAALVLLLTIHLVEYNLRASYIDSYPEDAPNIFFLDIQKNQADGFRQIVQDKNINNFDLHPVIRSRLLSINDKSINLAKENERKSDSLSREFNLTYRDKLLDDEAIIEGDSLYGSGQLGRTIPVSILDTVAAMGNIKMGDKLKFNIQGVPISAIVVSVRTQTSSKLSPFFYFVFPAKHFESAPQTFFAALQVREQEMSPLIRAVSDVYPNVSTINVSETAESVGRILEKLVRVIRFFAAFSLVAGGLIIVSSIFATRLSRVREAVYYKIMGSTSGFVQKVFLYENIMLGALGILPALLISQLVTLLICDYIEISYSPNVTMTFWLCFLTELGVVAAGWLSSIAIVREKPGQFLREESVE